MATETGFGPITHQSSGIALAKEILGPAEWCRVGVPTELAPSGFVEVAFFDLSSEDASAILDRLSTKNRSLRPTRISRYGRAIQEWRWVLNGETIIFDDQGRLFNGYHRLTARKKTPEGRFPVLVVIGVSESSYPTIDEVAPRSAADTLNHRGLANWSALQAAGSILYEFLRSGVVRRPQPQNAPDNTALADFIISRPGLSRSISWMNSLPFRLNLSRKFTSTALASFFHYVWSSVDQQLAEEFLSGIGEGTISKDPSWAGVRLLNSRLEDNQRTKAKLKQHYIAALTIKAWNLVRCRQSVRFLRWYEGTEDYPLIDGLFYQPVGGFNIPSVENR